MGDSRERLRFFPSPARREAGFELQAVQEGKEPSDWKPMSDIGAGVKEIRVHMEGEYRVLYVAKFQSLVYVLHAFVKKRRKTSPAVIALARSRYQEVLRREGQRE
jgi:phage-related protein